MNNNTERYGVKIVARPKIKAMKILDLSSAEGQQVVKSESKLVLKTHRQTFTKLAHM